MSLNPQNRQKRSIFHFIWAMKWPTSASFLIGSLVILQALYRLGARKFWVYNTGPIGCLPQTLALQKKNDSEVDELGCLRVYNNAAKAFNEGLRNLCDKIRSELQDGIIVHTDMFAIKYDLFANPGKYGKL